MTEEQWPAATEPDQMLHAVEEKVSNRKSCLFAVACCRRMWPHMPDQRRKNAVEVAGQIAGGEAT